MQKKNKSAFFTALGLKEIFLQLKGSGYSMIIVAYFNGSDLILHDMCFILCTSNKFFKEMLSNARVSQNSK